MQLLDSFDIGQLVPALRARNDVQILLFGFFISSQHFTDARPIDTDRLFGEDVLTRFNRSLQV